MKRLRGSSFALAKMSTTNSLVLVFNYFKILINYFLLNIILNPGLKIESPERFLFDPALSRRLYPSPSRSRASKKHQEEPLDESDECDINGEWDQQQDDDDNETQHLDLLETLGEADLLDYSRQTSLNNLESSSYAQISSQAGIKVIKKSTLCWFLENSVRGLSNDRTLRVMQSGQFHEQRRDNIKTVERRKLLVGDWALFWEGDEKKGFHVGRVLSFSFLKGAKKSYSLWEWENGCNNSENIGALCV